MSKLNLDTLSLQENEFFQENLRQQNQRLLKVSKDRSYLLDRLLKYETAESSTESEPEETSEDDTAGGTRKRKLEMPGGTKKKIKILKKQPAVTSMSHQTFESDVALVEKHLESRSSISVMPSINLQEIFDDAEES